jgi:hypothetical protein
MIHRIAFVAALGIAGAAAGFAQSSAGASSSAAVMQSSPAQGASLTPQQKAAQETLRAQMQAMANQGNQAGCPLYLESAQVTPSAAYLPVGSRQPDEGALDLRFRNQSGKAIASVSITAHLRAKHNIYDLDASELDLRLMFSGVSAVDKAAEQLRTIQLPEKMYMYGVARVSLDQVTFDDGGMWTASATRNNCTTTGPPIERIEMK